MGLILKKKKAFHYINIGVFAFCSLICMIAILLTDKIYIEVVNFILILVDSSFLTYHMLKLGELKRCAKDLRNLAMQVLSNKDED